MNTFHDKLESVQKQLIEKNIDGWLFYDFRRSNSLALTILDIAAENKLTRRFFYWVPRAGSPVKLVSLIEPHVLDHLPGTLHTYTTWNELNRELEKLLQSSSKIAMEYSPNNEIPVVSKVDAGTFQAVLKCGVDVVSSADLLQSYTSVWSEWQLETHRFAALVLEDVAAQTWSYLFDAVNRGLEITEWDVQQWMHEKIHAAGCITDNPPVCAVNAHSADPHYSPKKDSCSYIKKGDLVLIDLWCKQKIKHAVYADITRMAVVSSQIDPFKQEIFSYVKRAQEAALDFIRERIKSGKVVYGWEVDDKCRQVIEDAGYGAHFIHRTGHNLGEDVHGSGANLDNYETHDFRQLLPGTAFTIEPGIYLPGQFGVRLEFDVYLKLDGSVEVYGGVQNKFETTNN